MKSLFTLLVILFSFQILSAQEFEVREFKADPSDLTARTQQERTVNDEPCALVKVNTNIKGMQFESNIGIVNVVHQADGYWLYIAPKERIIKIMAGGFFSLEVNMPEPAVALRVYNLVVAQKFGGQISDLVKVTFRMNQSSVYVQSNESAPVLSSGSNAVFNLPKGVRTFRFIKDGFFEEEETVNIQEEEIIDITLKPGAASTKLTLSGHVIITSDPPGAEVYLNEQRVGSTSYQNRHLAGNYTLRIQLPNYYDHVEQFELKEGATIEIPRVNLKSRFGYWQVNSTPEGAEVFLSGRSIGVAPIKKQVIASGLYEVTVRRTNYHEHKETFRINDGDIKTLNIVLKEAFGDLEIISEPSDAKVFIDNKEVGKTRYRNSQMPSGTYSVRIVKELYADANETLTVVDGKKTEKFISLTKSYGTLKINALGSEISVNGKSVGSHSYNANLTPGEYKIKASKSKHSDDERTVFVMLGQTEDITLTPKSQQGAISISTSPFETRGAEIFIDGIKQKQATPATIPLLIGNYNITVKKAKYIDVSQTVKISEGKEEVFAVKMITFSGSQLQQAKKHRVAKVLYGTTSLVAAGAGAYFRYSVIDLTNDYKLATDNATDIYSKIDKHDLYSWVAFGAAVPLGVMSLIKSSQYKSKVDMNMRSEICRNDKYFYGSATIISLGFGGLYRYSVHKLSNDYNNATTDATSIYGKIERHEFISNAAFAIAVPFAVMTIINSVQQNSSLKNINAGAMPTRNGLVFGLNYQF